VRRQAQATGIAERAAGSLQRVGGGSDRAKTGDRSNFVRFSFPKYLTCPSFSFIDRRRFDDGRNALNLSKLRATDVTAFLQRHAPRHSPSQARKLKMCKTFDTIRLVGARQRHLW
jgi:hypothetical protein